ncbi:MAG: hypothetical protein IJO63_04465 [Bacilli bacterium]|nr:hypothetical protein [Bacilli bacterium]
MEVILEFAKEYYLVFTIISVILVLALIGYLVEKNVSKDVKIKGKKENAVNVSTEEQVDSI